MNKKAETIRDGRLSRDEEKRLLDTALGVMNTVPHQYVGEMLHDPIIGALELCCRRGEMLLIQNKRINWDTCQIGVPGATAKDKENRRIPFNPKGRLAAILKRRSSLAPNAFVFGSTNGEYQPTIQTAWETLKLLANGITPRLGGKEAIDWNGQQVRRIDLRWHDLRHEGACRLLSDGVDIRIIQLMLEHSADAALLERDGRRTQERSGGELDQLGPAASGGVRPMKNRARFSDGLSPICPRDGESVAPQVGLEPTTLRLTAGCSAIELLRNAGWSRVRGSEPQ